MNNISEFNKCANCGSCYNACPKNAISVQSDDLFYTLSVNEDKCTACGICKSVCPVNLPQEAQTIKSAYAVVHDNEQVVKESSSGGLFSALAEWIIERGGVVFGATFTNQCACVEISSTQNCTLDDLRRSKYVESKVGNTFREVKSLLNEGKYVLYCAAPCQIAGLKRYLHKEYERLITCDFSCGGMPSHKIYQDYLELIAGKLDSKISEVNFRPKTYGWAYYAIKIKGENQKCFSRLAVADPYFGCFLGSHVSVRDYCLSCEFANNHYSDIILADFWKYKTISNVRNGNKGISLALTNSPKGEAMIEAIRNKVALTILDTDKASYNLKNKTYTETFLEKRNAFLELCKEKGFAVASKKMRLKSALNVKLRYYIKKFIWKN